MKLLISCVGAYNDSGIGSGGLLAIDLETEDVKIIDTIDSTGLSSLEDKVFRYARGIRKLVCFNEKGILSTFELEGAKDVHDVKVLEDKFMVVSTGINSIQYYDQFGSLIDSFNPGGTDDAWHLNCVEVYNGEMFFTAFGDFKEHREWNQNAKESGFIFSFTEKKPIINKLSGPHNPRVINGKWWVCNSHEGTVNIYDFKNKNLEKVIDLGGFTRGMLHLGNSVWIGVNANRKEVGATKGKIVSIDTHKFEIEKSIHLPMPEIYDLLKINDMLYTKLVEEQDQYSLTSGIDRQVTDNFKNQVDLMEDQIIRLKTKLREQRFYQKVLNKIRHIIK